MPEDHVSTVLVIDDEYGALLQVELALLTSTSVMIVGTATNGSQGAELAEQLQPDVVILDLSMPVMDGFEALPLLRAVAPRATIVIRSSHDDEASIQAALELGAATYIPKFLRPDDLRRIVERAAKGHVSPYLRTLSFRGRKQHAQRR